MPQSLNDYVKAGVIAALVRHHSNMGGRDTDWVQTTLFAYREFRDAEQSTIDALIRMAKAAKTAADIQCSLRAGEKMRDCDIPGTEY